MALPARALLMIKPSHFGFNPQTAATNSFQHATNSDVHEEAVTEFRNVHTALTKAGITIELFEDDAANPLPDSIFPNNWFSTHAPSTLVIYPMMTTNRRAERKPEIISALAKKYDYTTIHDLSNHEQNGQYLEGTGSMVFDHDQQIAYACASPRTNKDVLLEACERIGYLPVVFEANDRNQQPIYHTNVMLALSEKIAVCCFDSIVDKDDSTGIKKFLRKTGKAIVEISITQMEAFAGNLLFIRNASGILHVAVSAAAWNGLNNSQRTTIAGFATPIVVDIPTIEKYGGGGIRCMLAELF